MADIRCGISDVGCLIDHIKFEAGYMYPAFLCAFHPYLTSAI